LAGGAPIGIKTIHESMESGIVAGLEEMAELMDYDVLDTPVR
jgi:hypothetical protein